MQQHLLNEYQRDFPLTPRPFADIASQLQTSETEIIVALEAFQSAEMISRVGPIFAPRKLGASTLAAMAVPADRLEAVAEMVNTYAEVNHNYEREHRFNLWFVATAPDQAHLDAVLAQIETSTECKVVSLPLLADYHIDLGFPLEW